MSVQSAVADGRAAAQALMDSVVRIRRRTGQTRDPESGTMVPTWATVYEGPGRIRFSQADPRDTDAAGQRIAEQTPVVVLPIAGSGGIRVDDEGEVLSNPPDPAVVGLRFRVAGVHAQTHSTSRRLPVEVYSHA